MSFRKEMEKDFMLEFIHLYKKHSALWKVKSREYSDRSMREKGILELLEKIREVDSDATKDTVKKKINCMRTAFKRECRKMEISKRRAVSADDFYTPKLWYFQELMFTRDQDIPSPSTSSTYQLENDDPDNPETPAHNTTIEEADDDETQVTQKKDKRKRKGKERSGEILELIATSSQTNSNPNESFGKYVTDSLNNMDSRTGAIAKKLISGVLFEGEIGRLSEATQISQGHGQHFQCVSTPQASSSMSMCSEKKERAEIK